MVSVLERLPESTQEPFLSDKKATAGGDQWAVLAGLRFVLAFIVLVSHTRIIVGVSNFIYRSINVFGSHAAVAGFFIISGYSIASSLQRDTSNFYARRFWRIYPVYLAAFFLSMLPFMVFGSPIVLPKYFSTDAPRLWDGLGVLFFLQGICVPLLEINSPIWSISIEVIYYALAPIFRHLRPFIVGALIAASAIIYGSGFLAFHATDYARERYGFSALAWLCFWLLGFELYRSRGMWRYLVLLLPAALLCLNNECSGALAPFTLAVVGLLIVQAPTINIPSEKIRRFLDYLGDLSYPLYLVHVPVFIWIYMLFHTKNLLVHIVISLLVSAIVLTFVDKPLRPAWKKFADLRSIFLLMVGVLLVAGSIMALGTHWR